MVVRGKCVAVVRKSKWGTVEQLGSGPAVVSVCFQMFTRLNLTIALSSLELWTEKNKIPTMGDAEELLQRFLQWKNIHRVLRLQDITFLFV